MGRNFGKGKGQDGVDVVVGGKSQNPKLKWGDDEKGQMKKGGHRVTRDCEKSRIAP